MDMEMDQETAKKLLVEGGTFVFLGVPQETQFGIDMQCWNTDEDFRGIKMIPPGLHYVHYAAVSRATGDVSPRSGFLHYFHKKEFLVKMWDKKTEDISTDEISEESIQRLKDNLLNLDRHLAPYPYEIWQKWRLLTSQITAELATKLSPEKGIIRSSVELLPMTDRDRPRGAPPRPAPPADTPGTPAHTPHTPAHTPHTPAHTPHTPAHTPHTPAHTPHTPAHTPHTPADTLHTPAHTPNTPADTAGVSESAELSGAESEETSEPGRSDAKRAKRLTRDEMENAMLPDLKPVPGSAMRYTARGARYPAGSSAAEVTRHCLDQTYSLDLMVAAHDEPLHIIGELQVAYLCFLVGHSLESFEHWKGLVVLLCSCEAAIHKYRSVYFHFIRTLEVQLAEMPAEFLADIVMNRNLVYRKLREFFRTADLSEVDGRLRAQLARLRARLEATLRWDFTALDDDDDDERPVVVALPDD